ncbi:MAG: DNA-directed RNA polymerase subunit omega [Lachnospiraceae bacterium]|nr:DNA-directed RNA polymerase subunit omega [Lachnospiraceae bacterium]
MLHPSYTDLMAVVNSDVEPGEQPVVQSRYSIVLATAKRARQLISGQEPLVRAKGKEIKPLSVAVEELYNAKIKILNEDDAEEEQEVIVSEDISDMENMNSCEELPEESNVEEPYDEIDTEDFEELNPADSAIQENAEETVLKKETDLEK